MKKSLAKLSAYEQHKMQWTARFGYAMFALVLVNVIYSFFALADSIQHVKNGGGQFLPQFLWFVSLSALSAVVPPAVAYLVGGRQAKTNSVHEHHYNGVLFALLAGWLTLTFSFFPVDSTSFVYIPAVVAAISLFITVVIAIGYGKHAKQVRLQEYVPYRIGLIGSIVAIIGLGVATMAQSLIETSDPSVLAITAVPILAGGLFVWFGYKASRESNRWSRIIDSLVAISIGTWTANLFVLFLYTLHVVSFIQATPLLVGALAWAVYLYLIHLRASAVKTNRR